MQQTCVRPYGKIAPEAGTQTIEGLESQRSDAVTLYVTDAPLGPEHSTVVALGHWIAGGVVSTTVTLKQHCAEFAAWSVALQQICVVPKPKTVPEAGLQTIVGFGSHVSVAVTVYGTVAPLGDVHSALMSGGHVIAGGRVSTIVIVKQQRELFCEGSVAVQQTCVWPIGKVEPEAWSHAIVGFGSQASVAVTVKVTGLPSADWH